MKLGDIDSDGRRKTLRTADINTMYYETVISATGARVDCSLMEHVGIDTKKVKQNLETNIDGVYIAGDCRRGAATIVEAVADSKTIAKDILSKCGLENDFIAAEQKLTRGEITERKAVLADSSEGYEDCSRCLACSTVCEICCDVCPNRANISVEIDGAYQILHIDAMCNHCGNCGVFCPHDGDPAKDKATLFWSRSDFERSENKGWMFIDDKNVLVRDINGKEFECEINSDKISTLLRKMINTVNSDRAYMK